MSGPLRPKKTSSSVEASAIIDRHALPNNPPIGLRPIAPLLARTYLVTHFGSGASPASIPSLRGARAVAVLFLVLVSILAGGSTSPAAGQVSTCTQGLVSRIEIQNNSLFSPDDLRARSFSWVLGFADWMHIRTRQDYLRDELLVKEGDCYDEAVVDESARFLRELNFIARVEAGASLAPDSTWVVRVETWDEWSTQFSTDFDVEGRFRFKGLAITEKNLAGRGLRLSFRYRNFRERRDKGLALSTERLLGTGLNASVEGGSTRTGNFFRQELAYPFVSESSRFSFESRFRFEDREHSYVTGDHSQTSHVLLPLEDFDGFLRVGRRYGTPGSLTLVGGEMEFLHREVSAPAWQVWQGDFGKAITAADSFAVRLGPQDTPDSFLRVGATVGIRRLRFTTASGLDRITGEQNVALGSEVKLTVGRTVTTWGTSDPHNYGRLEGFLSGERGPVLAVTSMSAEGRYRDAENGDSPWRDLALVGHALLYVHPQASTTHTFVTGTHFWLHGNVDQPHQLALGGEEGVRSYRDDQVPTGSSVVAFAEHRVNLPWFRPGMDLGLTVFGDLGRGWANNVPFGIDTGWRAALGGGIRIGFPAGTRSVSHLELAWPVGGPDQGRGPVFRTYWAPTFTSR